MLFNWVQPLFNRYAQRCAKGVTRVVLDKECCINYTHPSITIQSSICTLKVPIIATRPEINA